MKSMKVTVIYGLGEVRIVKIPDASLKEPTNAYIRVTLAVICGSDF
jgi:threonine dehydrogenase-like Zn-dependent dehydrogenase